MPHWKSVAILGVGLMGGSLGLALRRRGLADEIVGIGRSRESLQAALACGAVTRIATDLADGLRDAEIIVVCTPVALVAEQVQAAAAVCSPNALATDVGSTKRAICDRLSAPLPHGVRFVGGHPICGGEKAGVEAARADLYENRVVVLTPTATTLATDAATLTEFWTSVGAKVVEMSPHEHDEALAHTSHAPHLVAAALAAALPHDYARLTGTGFRDVTRVAAGGPELWRQIFLDNRDAV
ncbi:MAG TPA: prephenate dehydrogenase/arogenate dehydrogenase family protein, partial [Pirellulales bacterium]